MAKGKDIAEVMRQLRDEGVKEDETIILYTRDGFQCGRRMPKGIMEFNTLEQIKVNTLVRDIAKFTPLSAIATHKKWSGNLSGGANFYEVPMGDQGWSVRFIGGNVLADTVDWAIPRLVLGNDKKLPLGIKQELIWAGLLNDRIAGIAFAPPMPNGYTQMAMRIVMTLHYCGYRIDKKIVKAIQIKKEMLGFDIERATARLGKFYKGKALEFFASRYAKWGKATHDKYFKGAQFIKFIIEGFNVSKSIFGVEKITIGELDGGVAHLWCDLVGAQDENFVPVKSDLTNELTIKLPQHQLSAKGRKIKMRLQRVAKKNRKKVYSNPVRLKRMRESERQKRLFDPQYRKRHLAKRSKRFKERYKNDPEFRKRHIAQRKRSDKKHNRNKQIRDRYHSDPQFRAEVLASCYKWRKEHKEQVNRHRREKRLK